MNVLFVFTTLYASLLRINLFTMHKMHILFSHPIRWAGSFCSPTAYNNQQNIMKSFGYFFTLSADKIKGETCYDVVNKLKGGSQ